MPGQYALFKIADLSSIYFPRKAKGRTPVLNTPSVLEVAKYLPITGLFIEKGLQESLDSGKKLFSNKKLCIQLFFRYVHYWSTQWYQGGVLCSLAPFEKLLLAGSKDGRLQGQRASQESMHAFGIIQDRFLSILYRSFVLNDVVSDSLLPES